MSDVIIYGAGIIGGAALGYYSQFAHVKFIVDKDVRKHNKCINGVSIYGLEVLDEETCDLVIAVRHGAESIAKELGSRFRGKIFYFDVSVIDANTELISEKKEGISIHFSGGLGNQMFQYALFTALNEQGKNIMANISACNLPGKACFILPEVFDIPQLTYISSEEENSMIQKAIKSGEYGEFCIYNENMTYGIEKRAEKSLLKYEKGIIWGIHQTYYFAEIKRKELLKAFKFNCEKDASLSEYLKKIPRNAVSMHIRRGDYLTDKNACIYGDICTDAYYEQAIKLIKEKVNNPTFLLFSDDIEYVKKNFIIENAIYVEKNHFSTYEDWYDMFLMSKCEHNIIANSTFSWWGAWLNQNPEKIVIAPRRWINKYDYMDIYPKEWIKI